MCWRPLAATNSKGVPAVKRAKPHGSSVGVSKTHHKGKKKLSKKAYCIFLGRVNDAIAIISSLIGMTQCWVMFGHSNTIGSSSMHVKFHLGSLTDLGDKKKADKQIERPALSLITI